jgi:4-hydroxy-tetrahydrodipicolinate reductase
MDTAIVIVGANGRMGRTIAGLVSPASDLKLAGLVDRPEHLDALAAFGCPVADSLKALPPTLPRTVIVDFTTPEVSLQSAQTAAETGRALVVGTTGFTEEQMRRLRDYAVTTPIFWSSNMSVGLNVMLKILPELVRGLGPGYDMELVEIHHNRKKDSPSGTALMLGECLAGARGWNLSETRCTARDGIIGERPETQIGVQAVRGGDVVGVHTVYFLGQGERIELAHHAHSRENFARGALRAASWLVGRKPGQLYNMQDLLAETC